MYLQCLPQVAPFCGAPADAALYARCFMTTSQCKPGVCQWSGPGVPVEAGVHASAVRPALGSLAFLAAVEASWQLHERCAPSDTPWRHAAPGRLCFLN